MNPLVTAIIPAFNGERFLRDAIESVLNQDYEPLELIVVDDGSTDRSAALARSCSGVHLLSQLNQGVATARNLGIRAAQGELLAFLDQDDIWEPRKLAVQVAHLLDHPELDYVLAWQRLFLEPGSTAPPSYGKLLERPHPGYFPGTLLAWRRTFDVVGFYRDDKPPVESADWFARANDAGMRREIIPEVLLRKRLHDDNQSNDLALTRTGIVRTLQESIARKRASGKV